VDYGKRALVEHEKFRGKLTVGSKMPLKDSDDLSIAYTPGVAAPCRAIAERAADAYKYTMKGRTIAVVTDGTAVLGLGDIGATAALPVMEGKAVLFKEFADLDAFPICLDTTDVDEIVHAVKLIAPGFGGINLEDISAPRCFEIERKLQAELDIPVFHDDQHGTAIVVAAATMNACRLLQRDIQALRVVISGAGAAGTAIAQMLLYIGIKHIVVCDSKGILSTKRDLEPSKRALLEEIAAKGVADGSHEGSLADALQHADLFIGVSAPGIVSAEMVQSMNPGAIVFALSNPTPEIMPDLAKQAGAAVVGTGRSDFPNQINNVLVFPGIFKGALMAGASRITREMMFAAAEGLCSVIPESELTPDHIIPSPFIPGIADRVAEYVQHASKDASSE
jgi:malate dehydrogenase (oxaloacetate-decarboxylating)